MPDFIPIRFETAGIGFLKEGRPNKKNKNKMGSDMRSVPDPKIWSGHCLLFSCRVIVYCQDRVSSAQCISKPDITCIVRAALSDANDVR